MACDYCGCTHAGFLYHGTDLRHKDSILSRGLLPSNADRCNWQHDARAWCNSLDRVFFTTCPWHAADVWPRGPCRDDGVLWEPVIGRLVLRVATDMLCGVTQDPLIVMGRYVEHTVQSWALDIEAEDICESYPF